MKRIKAECLEQTLRSVFSTSGELIYVPVDTAASMRPLIDCKEAAGYLGYLVCFCFFVTARNLPVSLFKRAKSAQTKNIVYSSIKNDG
ncbi:MAG: hypothetical protein K2K53_09820 [Oscillospiraceae bacterium]|nr:hypothetical protein [Oscillospiraceae bacterium]